MLSLGLLGVCSVTFAAGINSGLQLAAAPEMRGRVMAIYSIVFLGSTVVGGPIAGWLGEAISPRAPLVAAGLAGLLVAVGAYYAWSERFAPVEIEEVVIAADTGEIDAVNAPRRLRLSRGAGRCGREPVEPTTKLFGLGPAEAEAEARARLIEPVTGTDVGPVLLEQVVVEAVEVDRVRDRRAAACRRRRPRGSTHSKVVCAAIHSRTMSRCSAIVALIGGSTRSRASSTRAAISSLIGEPQIRICSLAASSGVASSGSRLISQPIRSPGSP